jgi:hypothetical protein
MVEDLTEIAHIYRLAAVVASVEMVCLICGFASDAMPFDRARAHGRNVRFFERFGNCRAT